MDVSEIIYGKSVEGKSNYLMFSLIYYFNKSQNKLLADDKNIFVSIFPTANGANPGRIGAGHDGKHTKH